jgi:hypothetical protein
LRYSRALHRRLDKLEATTNVPSTDDKWRSVRARALQFLSDDDLGIMEEIAVSLEAGKEVESIPEREAMLARYEEATFRALGEQKIRFTVAEMDQLLQDA